MSRVLVRRERPRGSAAPKLGYATRLRERMRAMADAAKRAKAGEGP